MAPPEGTKAAAAAAPGDEKPITRLGRALLQRSSVACTLLLLAGSLGLLCAPLAEKKMFFDENALLPGAAVVGVNKAASAPQASDGRLRAAQSALAASNNTHTWQQWLTQQMRELSLSSQTFTGASGCMSAVGVLEPDRGDGKEAIVLVTPVWAPPTALTQPSGAPVLAAALGLLAHLRGVAWLSKSIILVAPDASCGFAGSTAVGEWLAEYHGPPPMTAVHQMQQQGGRMLRGGRIQQALVVEMPPGSEGSLDRFEVLMQGPWGETPNLDIVHLTAWTARRYTGLPVDLATDHLGHNFLQEAVQPLLTKLGVPPLSPGHLAYAQKLIGMGGFIALQLSGSSTGSHSPFHARGADAVTLRAVADAPARPQGTKLPGYKTAMKLSEVMEVVVHSCSNLVEALHHSYKMYAMLGAHHFVTPEVYLVPTVLIVLAFLIQAAAVKQVDSGAGERHCSSHLAGNASGWAAAITAVLLIHVCCWVALAGAIRWQAEPIPPSWLATASRLGVPASATQAINNPLALLLLRATAAAAFLAAPCLALLTGRKAPWKKVKVTMLALLTAECTAVLCANWAVAFVTALVLAPAALLCCPWTLLGPETRSCHLQQGANETPATACSWGADKLLRRAAAAATACAAPALMTAAVWVTTAYRLHVLGPQSSSPSAKQLPHPAMLTAVAGEASGLAVAGLMLFLPAWYTVLCIGISCPAN
mmetsp:Transcript_40511/g.114746  ORF Transcript_40511/g.114746 Transcript_40511/m.114746 type:complete len:705 (-) Transcript_40511:134-2248(-)